MPATFLRWLRSVLLLTLLAILPILAHAAAAGVDRWTPIGPDGGEILSLADDPDAPGLLYAGTRGGGVWKSVDGGGSWEPTPEGLGDATIYFLAVSAGRVYAGTYYSMFLLTEGAATWRQVGPFPFGIQDFAVDPGHPGRVWAAGDYNGGVLLSEDGGEHWSSKLRLAGAFYAVAIAPSVPPTIYASGSEGIFASTDVGTTWRQVAPIFSQGPALELAVDPTDAATLYAGSTYSGFWKSTDAGAHWSFTAGVSPSHLLVLPEVLLGAGGFLARSEDGGDTWESVDLPWWDVFALAADRTAPDAAWLSVRGGGLLHTADGGQTWQRSSGRGLRATNIRAFAFDPFRSRTLYAATFEPVLGTIPPGRLQRSVDSGVSWSKPLTLLGIRSLAADPRRSGTLYAGTPRGVSISHDRGAHWQRVLNEPAGIDTVVVDPNRPGTVWAGGYRMWRSQDAGHTWARAPRPNGLFGTSTVRRIFLSPWHPETLYLIDFHLDGFSVPGSLWRSTDGGATWEEIDGDDPVALAFDPVTPDLLYVADFFGDVRRSRDGGTTWELVASAVGGDGNRLTALLVDRLDPSILYAGSAGSGVWRSRDQGATWQSFSPGLVGPSVTCLEADPRNPRRLVACTWGGGLLEMRISPGS